MKQFTLPILFALGTALCWGMYGPTLGFSRSPQKIWSPFKPYVGIGMAYIVWAFVGGLVAMYFMKDNYAFSGKESAAGIWGFAAGTLGALGALSLTSSMLSFDGPPKAQLVMPIVFGGAVTINAIVSIIMHRSSPAPNPLLWLGMLLVIGGIILVAMHTPHGGPGHKKPDTHAATTPEVPSAAENSSGSE